MAAHLNETFPFLINRVAALISDAANRQFKPLGLNVFGARVLILLFLDDARTVGELAERAGLDQSTLSHILRRLARQGYLTKERLAHDNRSVLVSLTARGRQAAQQCWKWVQVHDAMLTGGMNAASKRALKDFLNALYGNVPAFLREPKQAGAKAVPRTRASRATAAATPRSPSNKAPTARVRTGRTGVPVVRSRTDGSGRSAAAPPRAAGGGTVAGRSPSSAGAGTRSRAPNGKRRVRAAGAKLSR